jgi:transketolase N-terminal domain/subunit
MDYKDLDRKVIKLAKQTVKMCTAAGSGHPSSGLSLIHIVTALMYRLMRYDPKNPSRSSTRHTARWAASRAIPAARSR